MINTLLLVGILFGGAVSVGSYKTEMEGKISTNASEIKQLEKRQDDKWTNHDNLHKERQTDIGTQNGRNEERFRALERDVQKIDKLDYRLTSTETITTNTAQAIKELQALISQQAGDLREVRAILQRLEASEQRRVR
ncbi:hypothetical protein [Rhizobium rhizosphaerae]|nr:hypothetical protein [Xaviernesmea rhizosphaerae]